MALHFHPDFLNPATRIPCLHFSFHRLFGWRYLPTTKVDSIFLNRWAELILAETTSPTFTSSSSIIIIYLRVIDLFIIFFVNSSNSKSSKSLIIASLIFIYARCAGQGLSDEQTFNPRTHLLKNHLHQWHKLFL